MKTKPVAHKEQNTFRFKTFSQQLAEINIGVCHEIGKRTEAPEDADTFFHETLLKWDELNCTEAYVAFRHSLPRDIDIKTLPQLIFHEKEIVDCLKTHLGIPQSLCCHPLLELVVSLARDLQSDFARHFPDFFEIFKKHLLTKDAELLQQVFKTISYIFKFLWRVFIKDVKGIYSLYSPLLGQQQPEYIRNYAAESIAFLLRKVPDKDLLLNLIFSSLTDNPSLANGIGQLLFEVIRGVQQNFHSSADKMLYMMFSKLGKGLEKHEFVLPYDSIAGCLSQTVDAMLHYTSRELSSVLRDTYCKMILQLIENYEVGLTEMNTELVLHLERIFKLLSQAVAFKKASMMVFTKEFLQMLISAINFIGSSDEYGRQVAQCVSSLLLSPHLRHEVGTINSLVLPLYTSAFSFEVKFNFTKQMFAFGMFEKDVMPPFLSFCHDILLGEDDTVEDHVLISLTSMLLQFHPLPLDGDKFDDWRKVKLDFNPPKKSSTKKRKVNQPILECLQKAIGLQDAPDFRQHAPKIWAAVICFPHIDGIYRTVIPAHLVDLYRRLLVYCIKEAMDENVDFLLSQVVETMLLTMTAQEIKELITFDEIAKLLIKKSNNVHYLKIVDFICTYMRRNENPCYCSNFLDNIFPILLPNLASPFHQVRLLTLRILGSRTMVDENEKLKQNIFNVCLAAESVELSVQEFRERIKHLQCLEYSLVQSTVNDIHVAVPLYYLIGTLYVNFQPLWEPVIKLIETYARGMDSKSFWDVYGVQLRNAAVLAEEALKAKKSEECLTSDSEAPIPDMRSLFCKQKLEFATAKERVDYANHREMMWKAMTSFSDIAETRNRELSLLFLQFIDNEYYKVKLDEAMTLDVRKSVALESDTNSENEGKTDPEVCSISDASEVDAGEELQEILAPRSVKSRKHFSDETKKALCTHLLLFTKFRNPRFIFREQDLNELYLKLLMHPTSEIQHLALNCIMTYNHKFLTPYKESLHGLLDDKMFSSEIVRFSVEAENSVVVEEHRSGLMPIIMRILFGKMLKRYGAKAKGKDFFLLRRNTILHFLANCREEELKVFLDLVVLPLQQFTDGEVLSIIKNNISDSDFMTIIPPRRQIGILQLVGIIFEKLSHRITSYLPWLFKIILSVTSRITILLENREKINPAFLNVLKDVRTLALTLIMQFFRCFDNYPFSKQEIDALYMAAIWPLLERLPFEGVYSPSSLLKLFHQWSTNPRYFILLAKHHVDNEHLSPLHQIMQLLLSTFIRPPVTTMIFEILENLLKFEDYVLPLTTEKDEDTKSAFFNEGPVIQVNEEVIVDRTYCTNSKESPNYGTLIVLPHLIPILTKLKQQIEKLGTGQGSKKIIPERQLFILSRLSEFVTDSAGCTELAKLLIPFLSRRLSRSEDVEVNIYTIVKNLMELVGEPKQFVKPLSVLFATQNNRRSRSSLCDVFAVIARRDDTVSSLSNLVTMLNAWDPRRPEEPDFKTRLAGFQFAIEAIEKKECQSPVLLLIIYNCCHCIRTVEDLSLRDNASHCIQKMIATFAVLMEQNSAFVSSILSSGLLPEIRKGLKEKSEVVRHEFITILSVCAQACIKFSPLNELHSLKNEEFDLDFFENITHIQVHRRSRAMARLVSGDFCKNLSCNTLTHYILPITSAFLFSETYAQYNHLIDAAIELTGNICRYLPWNQYEKLLMFYLNKLPRCEEYQKVAVRILVAVLDAFHFDLSCSEEVKGLIAPSTFKNENTVEESNLEKIDDEELSDVLDVGEPDDSINTNEYANKVALATKIHKTIVNRILPQLHKCLTQKAPRGDGHNLAKRYYPEDNEILRVPVAIAMVKLLQHLPKGALEKSLPGVFMKICAFLKSRAHDIRSTARQTLLTIMDALGAAFLPHLIKDMSHILTRGYQTHVMTFTLNAVLNQLKPRLKPGDLDTCLNEIIAICHEELIGIVAEEKEVKQILAKTPEAKSTKAYGTYEILANFISRSNIPNLLHQIKEVLAETTSHTLVRKMKECLNLIVQGLVNNAGILPNDFLIYSHAILNENLSKINKTIKVEPDTKAHPSRPDSYIIQEEPGRNKAVANTSQRTNAHILVEFGLQLLYFSLKRNRVVTSSQEVLEKLDPFIHMLVGCLHSPHIHLITTSLRNLVWLLKCPLPSLAKKSKALTSALFALLTKYSGRAQGSTGEMIVCCFQAVTSLIRHVEHNTMDIGQLRALLLWVENDINDHARQSAAFVLLKAILAKKLAVPEIHDVMQNILEKSIISENESIRIQCRRCIRIYLLDYPLENKLTRLLEFIVKQLDYKEETGRESALEILTTIFDEFPENHLNKNAGLLFIPMATALCNDDSANCRKMIALSLKTLLQKISSEERTNLFSVVLTWLQDDKILHRKLAATLTGVFVEAEAMHFEVRLKSLLPILIHQLDPTKHANVPDVAVQRKWDHLLIQVLTTLMKILKECGILRKPLWRKHLDQMWEYIEKHLLHPHTWVNLLACQMYGLLFDAYPENEIASFYEDSKESNSTSYFHQLISRKLASLSKYFLHQLRSCQLVPELANQVVDNMVYLVKIINKLPTECLTVQLTKKTSTKAAINESEEEDDAWAISVTWLIKKFRREATHEIVNSPQITFKRSCFLKWIEIISLNMDKDELKSQLRLILPILLRELSDNLPAANESLKRLAQQLYDHLRKLVGIEFFTKEYVAAQSMINEKKATRKRKKAVLAVTDPQVFARKKIKKHELQVVAKKRKLASRSLGTKTKKPKLKDLAITT